jgi:large exoprotein involved in heme utilization and adhesion
LDIGGSFLASTASSLKFADGFEFSAINPQSVPLLSINVPVGLQYGANPGNILNQSLGFEVKPEKTLALVGSSININSEFIVGIPEENSDISANAFSGAGGNVQINTQGIFGIESRPKPSEKSDITASSELGVLGTININAPDSSSIQNSFTELSLIIDTNALIANSCISRGTKQQENSFTITGSGGSTTNRPGVSVSAYTTDEVRGVETTSRPWKKGDPIIEPTGLYRLNNGQLLLSRECSN